MGRPTKYRPEIAARIIEAVAAGGSIKKICAAEGVPIGTLYEWADANRDGFGERLERARLRRYDLWEDELFEHACAELGSESMPAVQARRMLIDTMRWIMARRLPGKWSEHVAHAHVLSGGAQITISLPQKTSEPPAIEGSAVELIGGEDEGRLIED